MGYGEMLTMGSNLESLKILGSFGTLLGRDERSIQQANAQAKRNNQLAERNYQLINEEQMATMVANGLDKFEIAKEIRRNKAQALARRGGTGSLSSASLQGSLNNIQREGSNAILRKDLNFGSKLRNLQIERDNVAIQTAGLNNQAFNQITQSADLLSTGLSLAGVNLDLKKKQLKLDPTTGLTN